MDFLAYCIEQEKRRVLQSILDKGIIETPEEWWVFYEVTRRPEDIYVEMAAPTINVGGMQDVAEVRKTPLLFDERDILYLYQFPPKYWTQALAYRYNDLVHEVHKEVETAKKNNQEPVVRNWRFVTLKIQGRYLTFLVNTGAKELYQRLTADVNMDYFAGVEGKQGIKNREQYRKAGYGDYGFVLGSYVPGGELSKDDSKVSKMPNPIQRDEGYAKSKQRQERDEYRQKTQGMNRSGDPDRVWVFQGYVGMSRLLASKRLGAWMEANADGWLAGSDGHPRREMFSQSQKMDWASLTRGGRPRERPVMVPLRDAQYLEQMNQKENALRLNALQTKFRSWELDPRELSDDARQILAERHWFLSPKDIGKMGFEVVVKDIDGQKVPCRVWKALRPSGGKNTVIEEIVQPLPMVSRGMLINNKMHRKYELLMAMKAKVEQAVNDAKMKDGMLADIRLGQDVADRAVKKAEDEMDYYSVHGKLTKDVENRLVDEMTYWQTLRQVMDHMDRYFNGKHWHNKEKVPNDQLFEALVGGDMGYIAQLERKAQEVVLDTANNRLGDHFKTLEGQKGLADEHDYNFYVAHRRSSLYHYVNGGGVDPNKGTKQYQHATQEQTDEYEKNYEKYFAYSHSVQGDDEAVPVVMRYPHDPEKELISQEIDHLQELLERRKRNNEMLHAILSQPRPPANGKERKPLLDLVRTYSGMLLKDIPDVDDDGEAYALGDRKAKRTVPKGKKKASPITIQELIDQYRTTGRGAFDLISMYQRNLNLIKSTQQRIRTLKEEITKGYSSYGPIGQGVFDFLDKIEGTPEYDALLNGMSLLYENIRHYIKRNLGDAYYRLFLAAEKKYLETEEAYLSGEGSQATMIAARKELGAAVKNWKRRVRDLAFNYAKSMWQLDIAGNGTRRERESRRSQGIPKKVSIGGSEEALGREHLLRSGDQQKRLDIRRHLEELDFDQDAFEEEVIGSLEGRVEREGKATSTSIDAWRQYLFKQIQAADQSNTKRNLQQIIVMAQSSDQDEQNAAYALDARDLALANLLKQGTQAYNLLTLGFIEKWKHEHNDQEPSEEVVNNYIESLRKRYKERMSKVLVSNKEEIEQNQAREDFESLPNSHPVQKAMSTIRPRGEGEKVLKRLVSFCQKRMDEYYKINNPYRLDAIRRLDLFLQELEARVKTIGTPDFDMMQMRGLLRPDEWGDLATGAGEKHLSVSKHDLQAVIEYYRKLIDKEEPYYQVVMTTLAGLSRKEAYSRQIPPEERMRRYIMAGQMLKQKKLILGNQILGLDERDLGPVRRAWVAASNEDPTLPSQAKAYQEKWQQPTQPAQAKPA